MVFVLYLTQFTIEASRIFLICYRTKTCAEETPQQSKLIKTVINLVRWKFLKKKAFGLQITQTLYKQSDDIMYCLLLSRAILVQVSTYYHIWEFEFRGESIYTIYLGAMYVKRAPVVKHQYYHSFYHNLFSLYVYHFYHY